ncbi:hypothetical protein HBH56_216070 [Parastagonospora nodorum]|uniref:Uncharacterized protein n=1 Tax=Phaeosphaeria nodorum (strain SN15 / ATCC MYA-4574 / FGSC 10173) TaxID=321614 RepID=A0A7U2EXX7_PHANO|nr:hypothetical protein HBH56_216070 [Parastagonospora nodorum]QRC93903.1 hypothetical protein JI435_155970 [Parastagonospora nodorum SN15]KAH3922563.1 hypothetical protein HBH54_221440 [Parastagonospora nodorum]KAH3961329.1 hypothetical protein HBH51_184750 [Parastagonospora nodorum]KAH3963152.1 hypothetical protein HBH52_220060 [Parastagonospora nodorum]
MLPCGRVKRISLARNATLLHNVVSAGRRTVTIRRVIPSEKGHTRPRSFGLTPPKKVRPGKTPHGPQECSVCFPIETRIKGPPPKPEGSSRYHAAVAEWSQSQTPIASFESKELSLAKWPLARTRKYTLLGSYSLDEHRRLYIPGSPPHLPPSIDQKELDIGSDPNLSNAVIPRAMDAVCPAIQIMNPYFDLASLHFIVEPSVLAEMLLGRPKPLLIFGSKGMPTLLGRLIQPPHHDSTNSARTDSAETNSVKTGSVGADSVDTDPVRTDSAETHSVEVGDTEETSLKGFNPGDAKLRHEITEPADGIPAGSNYCRIIQYKWGGISFAIHEKVNAWSLNENIDVDAMQPPINNDMPPPPEPQEYSEQPITRVGSPIPQELLVDIKWVTGLNFTGKKASCALFLPR